MQDRLPTKFISPVAAPVDTYVRPQEPYVAKPDMSTANSLQGVADALAKIHPKLDQFFQQQQKDYVADREAFGYGLNKNRENWNAFLDRLKKDDPDEYEKYAADNPHVQRGFNKAFLESAAIKYSATLTSELAKNPNGVFDASDPTTVNTWMTDHASKWMEENGVNGVDRVMVQDVFVPKMLQYQNSAASAEARERRERYLEGLSQGVGTGTTQLAQQSLANLDWEGDAAGSAQALGAQLTALITAAAESGQRDFKGLNEEVRNSIIALAEQNGDDRILTALQHVKTGKGFLADIGAHGARINTARNNIQQRKRNDIRFKQGQTTYLQGQVRYRQSQEAWTRRKTEWGRADKRWEEAKKNLAMGDERRTQEKLNWERAKEKWQAWQKEQGRNDTRWENYETDRGRAKEKYEYWRDVTKPWAEKQMERTKENWERTRNENGRKDAIRELETHVTTLIMNDPTKNWQDDPKFKELAKLDPSAGTRMFSFQGAFVVGREATSDDANSLAALMRDVATQGSGFDTRRISDAFTKGLITQRTMMSVWDDYRQASDRRKDPHFSDPRFTALVKGVRGAILKGVEGEAGGSALDAEFGVGELYDLAHAWKSDEANKGKGMGVFLNEMRQKARTIVPGYNPDAVEGSKELQFGNPPKKLETPSASQIEKLKANPHMWKHFRDKFGAEKTLEILQGTGTEK